MALQTPYVDLQNVTKSFGAQVLFNNISFSVAERQRVGLIAKNGTGKTTLLSIISGHERCDRGSVIFRKGRKVG